MVVHSWWPMASHMCIFVLTQGFATWLRPDTSEKDVYGNRLPGGHGTLPGIQCEFWGTATRAPRPMMPGCLVFRELLAPPRLPVIFIMTSLAYHRPDTAYRKQETCQKCLSLASHILQRCQTFGFHKCLIRFGL